MIEELMGLLEEYDPKRDGDVLHVGELEIVELNETSCLVDGYSSFIQLPKRFVYSDANSALPIIHPFILQAIDGEPRI